VHVIHQKFSLHARREKEKSSYNSYIAKISKIDSKLCQGAEKSFIFQKVTKNDDFPLKSCVLLSDFKTQFMLFFNISKRKLNFLLFEKLLERNAVISP